MAKTTFKMEVYAGRNYLRIDKHIVVTPHALLRAEQRGVDRLSLLRKIAEEREAIKDIVANSLGKGYTRGVFYLSFPSVRGKGKVLWELMDSKGKRLESVEEVEERCNCMIVLYTYLDVSQRYYKETPRSSARRKRDNRRVF